ncbi:HutD/Ves family protein [Neptunicoccus sediminis]|uniref:HutD/Ves family protein n=1 Tax=Neptunicoccus sediminis TaxID=1892596 RepID=UPI00084601D1|nr:HutD family protein [Neptunicoccus sediminis]
MNIIRKEDLVDSPWRNGGGITRNIATGVQGDRIVWRISRADVDKEGPFSNFAGLTRILTVVTNQAMDLLHEGGVLHARPWTPLEFDGGLAVTSRLPDGPLSDLNLMFDPTHCAARVDLRRGASRIEAPDAGHLRVLHVLSGTPQSGANTFGTADSLFLHPREETPVVLGQGDAVLDILIRPLDQRADIRLAIAER